MIYESSKDHGTGEILMIFVGRTPTEKEVREYAQKHYGVSEGEISISEQSVCRGLINPGSALLKPNAAHEPPLHKR